MENFSAIDTLWIIVGTVLVFMMQPGFAMLETGLTRAKNAGNVVMKNLMDFVIGSIMFWIIGFGLLQGKGNAFIGSFDLFSKGVYQTDGIPQFAFIMFQTVFCATAATIVSGAMAERTKFSAYLLYSMIISALVYPVEAHWIWGGGWLGSLGFHDCAGGTAVHLTGGIAALTGARILGPRIGKYDDRGRSKVIPGHSITLATLGIFLLWFAWFGFNMSANRGIGLYEQAEVTSKIFMVTNLCAAFSAVTTLFITWKRYHKPDIAMTLNGVLGGLVASTAGCNVLEPWSAAIIGIMAGFTVVFGIEFVDNKLKIDDPVGAGSVHGFCGALGTIMVGFFSEENGLLTTGQYKQLGVQCIGVLCVGIYVAFAMVIVFGLMKKVNILRVSREEEINGLDYGEHALVSAYGDFFSNNLTELVNNQDTDSGNRQNSSVKDMPWKENGSHVHYTDISSVVIICKESKFEALKNALNEIGVMGITVSKVIGCGTQKGRNSYYRGVHYEISLLPKIRVEVVVSKIPVELVVETARKVLYTGNIGDGKIFVYEVKNVIKVRTGEEGVKALQDPESYQDMDE